ncbi:SDR family NAD(P)-dependent oxidoreductase [Niallia endozanthoxylica]|uniref:Glucose 1-dehydrogenase n=1 Tax=Niallia endozanthoxylica TaxID=2036016 RepID=A0A5J5HY54_9BACI|nr:glucose 1-dehydrogenase [Niallia endozanthoxylica]KAA9027064.1 glucose 1-dehydrogenase [Niallia endozanthoxylica]
MNNRLDGKVILITGASGGQGRAEAKLFAKHGAKLVLTDVNEDGLIETVSLIEDHQEDILTLKHDISREEEWESVIAKTETRFGRLDGLINNAGILIRNGILNTSIEEFEKIQSINTNGTFLGMKHGAGLMKKSGGGSIINISSIWGLVGSPTSLAYHSSKGAIRLMSKSAAIELAKDYIRVNSIHPGVIATAMAEVQNGQHPLKEKTPWPTLGTPEDIAYGAMYLLSDESRFVTGTELVIDGGYTAQ